MRFARRIAAAGGPLDKSWLLLRDRARRAAAKPCAVFCGTSIESIPKPLRCEPGTAPAGP